MKKVIFHRQFEKHHKIRIARSANLSKRFDEQYALFITGVRNQELDDHPLKGAMRGKRAFTITGDIRVVYSETDEAYNFLDVGSHNQVYGK